MMKAIISPQRFIPSLLLAGILPFAVSSSASAQEANAAGSSVFGTVLHDGNEASDQVDSAAVPGTNTESEVSPTPDPSSAAVLPLLSQAYTNLSKADHDYKGHRLKAMRHLGAVIHQLGGKVKGDGRGREIQVASDDLLRAALGLLQQAQPQLSGRDGKKINLAIQEINLALKTR